MGFVAILPEENKELVNLLVDKRTADRIFGFLAATDPRLKRLFPDPCKHPHPTLARAVQPQRAVVRLAVSKRLDS